jgi:Skp family chaperone for outer membrane proteins
MRRATTLPIATLVLLFAAVLFTHRVWGEAAWQDTGPEHRVATVDILQLVEDMLQTEDYKPQREEFRSEWEERINQIVTELEQIQTEAEMMTQNDPGLMQLQQRYQQLAGQYQQLQQQAGLEFNQFSAEQAADAYAELHTEAAALGEELGYSHVIASRRSSEILDRANLATVTQEMLARPAVLSPESHDLTERLRERLDIPRVEAELGEEMLDMPVPGQDEPEQQESRPEESPEDGEE